MATRMKAFAFWHVQLWETQWNPKSLMFPRHSFSQFRFVAPLSESLADWWFGTFFIFPYIWDNHPNWLIFFRGAETTNQAWNIWIVKEIVALASPDHALDSYIFKTWVVLIASILERCQTIISSIGGNHDTIALQNAWNRDLRCCDSSDCHGEFRFGSINLQDHQSPTKYGDSMILYRYWSDWHFKYFKTEKIFPEPLHPGQDIKSLNLPDSLDLAETGGRKVEDELLWTPWPWPTKWPCGRSYTTCVVESLGKWRARRALAGCRRWGRLAWVFAVTILGCWRWDTRPSPVEHGRCHLRSLK